MYALSTFLLQYNSSEEMSTSISISCPDDYNLFIMGGVDLADHTTMWDRRAWNGGDMSCGECMIMQLSMLMWYTWQIQSHLSQNRSPIYFSSCNNYTYLGCGTPYTGRTSLWERIILQTESDAECVHTKKVSPRSKKCKDAKTWCPN